VERGIAGFRSQFSLASDPEVALGYFELGPGSAKVSVKDVLPVLFADQGRSPRN
jgi:hypothetical protein